MKIFQWLLFLLFLLFPILVYCQDFGPLDTDRPDQSDGVYTLPKNSLQLETGLIYGSEPGNYFLQNTMLRYGRFPQTELGLEFDYGEQCGAIGIMPVEISIKRGITDQEGMLPAITMVGHIGLPFLSTHNFRPHKIPAGLTMALENELSDQFSFAYNFGTYLDGEHNRLNWPATANPGFSLMDELFFS